jgi:5'-nucleotidase
MGSRPCILVTNDDGIDAPGLLMLSKALHAVGDVTIVAPSTERSAVGHAITLSDPLRVFDYQRNDLFYGYAVNGTPADCVKIAYWAILKRKPEIVVSGINLGSNTGINTIYSGTVSAATEGAILGIPSFAISLATYHDPDFHYAAKFACQLARVLLEKGLPKGIYLNVNIPACEEKFIQGIAITRQGQAVFEEKFDKRIDPHGRIYYWLSGQKIDQEKSIDVDDGAVQTNHVSVTPVHYDLTRYDFLDTLREWNLNGKFRVTK